ncbi:MAG: DEAD/DEAH box helicase [Spirulinaceae cyanobacterium]
MATLHGSWILQSHQGYFLVWGETWRNLNTEETSLTTVPLHPYSTNEEELEALLQSHQLPGGEKTWRSQIVTLPSYTKADQGKKKGKGRGKTKLKEKELVPVLSNAKVADFASLSLQPWQVGGYALKPEKAAEFLHSLPLTSFQSEDNYVGAELRFWCQVYRWSLDLLARGKFLPGLFSPQPGEEVAFWQPLLDSAADQELLTKFMRSMPAACLAYQEEVEVQELLLSFLNYIIDFRVRKWLTTNTKPGKENEIKVWLQALSQPENSLEIAPSLTKGWEKIISRWKLPLQDYLVDPLSYQLGKNPFRTCFALEPPEEPGGDWFLDYYLRSIDDEDFLVSAITIWQYPAEQITIENRVIEQPQETLLKGLGLAARIYEPIKATLQESRPVVCDLNPIQVYEFIRAIAWQFQDNGLGVLFPPGLTPGADEKRLGVSIKAQVAEGKKRLGLQSLLNFKLNIAIGDKTLSKQDFERLLAQKSPLVEVEGEWMALQPADVKAAQAVLSSQNENLDLSVEDALRLSQGDTQTLAKLPVVDFQASGVLKELIDNLNNNQSIKTIEVPQKFQGTLRPYQLRGVSWLAFLERWGLGACLADDMGLGKTAQLIGLILHLKEKGTLSAPTLIVCPTSVLGNWEREIYKFAPSLSVVVHHGDKRKKGSNFLNQVERKDLVVTSYALIYRDIKTLEKVEWEGIVLDEAQNIKNPQAKQSKAARELPAEFRIALTGTPVENRLSELWSILDFLNPGYLGTKQFFQRRFAIPIEKYGDRDSLQTLRSLVQPFLLRRLKTDKKIIQDLPEKQEMNVFCGLSEEQAVLYQQLVDKSLEEIEAAAGIQRHGLILTLLLRLKQVCNHPAHFLKEKKIKSAERSGKLLRLEEMLEEVVAEGDRALIFTQFSEWGKLLQPYLERKLGGEVLFLYGSTRRVQREAMLDRFQNDPEGPKLLILSLKAGGTGLNLTRANHVFHVDRWWNPAVENQATDRAFRIGQKRNVQVHKFVCNGTLEERINEIIESKKQLAEQTVDAGEQWLTKMDTDQLRNLLLLDRDAIIEEENL